jgi:N-acetyl-anhydromuramyl-L-alanine amidase AmpD
MRNIDKIIIHCTATRADWWKGKSAEQKVAEVRRWHVEDRGWSDIGYHYLIDRTGAVVEGRSLDRTGAHAKGHNTGSVGIALFGGHGGNASDKFEDNFTEDQDRALRELIDSLKADHPITKIIGHNEVSNKACPTFVVRDWLAKAPAKPQPPLVTSQQRTRPAQSRTVQTSVVQGVSAAGGAIAALQTLDGTAQIIVLVGCFAFAMMAMFILKERLKSWAAGWR